MRSRVQELMLQCLLNIQSNGPEDTRFGICSLLSRELPFAYGEITDELNKMFKSWDKYSGNETFPVPDPKRDPENAYLLRTGDIWDKRTAYGKNRWLLLDHLIVQLQSY